MPNMSPPRRRRTREETRELLLAAAVRVVEARVAGDGGSSVNPLADVLITDALDEANRSGGGGAGARTMTTGAAYNIWPTQAEFQGDLLTRILEEASMPGFDRVRAATLDGLARQLPWREVLAETITVDFKESFAEPSLFLMVGLAALASPADVGVAQRFANARYVEATGELIAAIVRYAGRRLRPGRSIADLVWAVEALEVGYLLRMRLDRDVPLREADDGTTALAAAAAGIVETFTEPDPT